MDACDKLIEQDDKWDHQEFLCSFCGRKNDRSVEVCDCGRVLKDEDEKED